MQTSKRFTIAIVLLFVIGGSFMTGFYVAAVGGGGDVPPDSLLGVEKVDGADVDFSSFWKAWAILDEKFAGTTTPSQEKVWGAIDGMTRTFSDPYTVFMPPEEAKMFEEEIRGNFEGVGMEVGIKDGRLTVVAPLKDTPAERSGIKPGDKIIEINAKSADGMTVDEAIKLIRGKAGTEVKITVAREGAKAPIEIKIIRGVIDIPTIKTTVKDENGNVASGTGLRKDGIFVIELYAFSANSANLFRGALKEFIASGSNKLVLDLRGNPGGYLDAAIDMASWFLPSGKIVLKEKFGRQAEEQEYRSKGYNVFAGKDLKMVILLNGGSASASEILAGALSENGIAKLVGTKSFGKGSVQELVPITDDTNLKVTVAKWFTPNGVSISEKGIIPDYEVPITEADFIAKKDPQMEKAVSLLAE